MTNSLDHIIGSTVYDQSGEKIGKVKELYLNDENGSPTWVAVSTGLFSSDSLVPLAGATHDNDDLRVQVPKQLVKDAPHLDESGHLTADEEQELFRHYGIDAGRSGWDNYGRQERGGPQAGPAGQQQGAPVGGQGAPADYQQAPPVGDRQDVGPSDREHFGDRAGDQLYVPGRHATAAAGAAGTAGVAGAAAGHRSADTQDPGIRDTDTRDTGARSGPSSRTRLRKYVVTEMKTVQVPVSHEEVRVVQADAPAEPGATDLDDETEVVLHEDRITVTKESVPVERVGLDVHKVEGEQNIRTERVDVEGLDD